MVLEAVCLPALPSPPSPRQVHGSSHDLWFRPRVVVKLVVMGQHLGKVALPPLSLSELQVHFHGPSRAPRLVVLPVVLEAVCLPALPSPPSPRQVHGSSHDLWFRPRVVVKLVVMGQHLGKVALPPLSLSELQVHFHGPSRAPRLVVLPVNFGTVAPSTCNISHQTKATPQAFPQPLVMTTSRKVAREGVPWFGTKLEHAATTTNLNIRDK
uniref:Uncharacterized protein n=1 Tax=Solanum tuberosum TaxID=4113 RepID=M1DED0_SOLTU